MTPGDGQQLRGWLHSGRLGSTPDLLLYKKPTASATSANQVGYTLWQWYFWPSSIYVPKNVWLESQTNALLVQ